MKGVIFLLGLVVLGALVGVVVASAGAVRRPVVPAMFVLGDSTLDVGNNNHLPGEDVPRANQPFYGVDFPGRAIATGRVSNGYNIADFIGTWGSRRALWPICALTRGVSYASAGAGILDYTVQVRYFAATKAEMEAAVGRGNVSRLLAHSFFLLGVGSNDLFQSTATTQGDVIALYTALISNYTTAITDLYGMGARKFGFISVSPLGCVPAVRVLNATGACNDAMNQIAMGFTATLKSALAGLAPKLPGLAYSLGDSFAALETTFSNPQAAGYENADSACCGSGRLGAEGGYCTRNSKLCADHDAYVYWDWIHSTQRAAELGAQALFNEGPAQVTAPISFGQLARKT
uniref:GDSL esterase/lipase n=1 Tax=Aegilops tauschii TaxID=37682 RepID=N1QYG0_AEGTA